MNLPNRLTMLRICFIPVFLVFYLGSVFGYPIDQYVALAIFVLASATDALDGYIARSRGLITNFGKLMDPLADKILVISALTAMVEKALLPSWVVITIIARELLITGFRLLAVEQGIVIAAGIWGKLKTITQTVLVVYLLMGLTGGMYSIIANILIVIAVALTIISGLEYILKNPTVFKDEVR